MEDLILDVLVELGFDLVVLLCAWGLLSRYQRRSTRR